MTEEEAWQRKRETEIVTDCLLHILRAGGRLSRVTLAARLMVSGVGVDEMSALSRAEEAGLWVVLGPDVVLSEKGREALGGSSLSLAELIRA